MRLLVIDDCDARALLVVLAVMPHPRLPEHLVPKAQLIIRALVVIRILRKRIILRQLEPMRRRAHPDHRPAAFQILIKVLHLLLREILETQKHHREVRRIQRLQARHVRSPPDNLPRRFIDIKKHRTLKSLMLREQSRHCRKRFLRAILVVPRQKDDVLALAGPLRAFVNKRRSTRESRERDEDGNNVFHMLDFGSGRTIRHFEFVCPAALDG